MKSERTSQVALAFRAAIILAVAVGITWTPASAQLGTATISGNVMDASGAVVPGATVTAVSVGTGFRRTTESGAQGEYNLPGLRPGPYDVTVESEGFRRAQQEGLVLQVDQNVRLNVTLEVGQITETVEITGEAPLIESQSATLGAVIDTQKITALPLNGRNFQQLALLVPGVSTGTEGGGAGSDGFSANGLRADQNAFQIDGTSNSDPLTSRITVRPSIDSLQEFKIQTNNYSAEFGKGAGAQVNIVTKSGTREFHGMAWEFLRNNAVQARNLFDRNSRSFPCDPSDTNVTGRKACAPQYNQNQFGGNLGGPIAERTFFFASFEGFRQRRGGATVTQVPTAAQRAGDFSRILQTANAGTDALGRTWQRGQLFDAKTSTLAPNGRYVRDPYINNQVPVTHFDPVARAMANNTEFMPLPNAPGTFNAGGENLNNWLDSRSSITDSEDYSGRIDHQFSDTDTIFGRYSIQDARSYSPRTFPGFGDEDNQRTTNMTVAYTKVFTPTVVADFRFGHQGLFQTSGSEDGLAGEDWLGTFNMPGMDFVRQAGNVGSPGINIAGFAGFGNPNGPFDRRINTFQPMAILSVTKGKHAMKFGGELRWVVLNSVGPLGGDGGTRGNMNFNNAQWTGIDGVSNTGHTAAAFLLGLATQKTRLVGDFKLGYQAREWGAFFQDDYKATNSLTLNFGVRYLYYTPPYDSSDRISTWGQDQVCPSYAVCGPRLLFDQNSPYQSYYGLAGVDFPRSLAATDKKNIGPRFGFAWQMDQKTVIRGGYGIFYDTVPITVNGDTLINYPQVIEDQENVALGQFGPPVPNALVGFRFDRPGLGTGGPGSVAQFQPGPNNFNPDFKNSYIQSWNFGIQRQLPGNVIVELAYAGSKGTRLHRQIVKNLAEPLGPNAVIGNLLNDPTIPAGIGDSKNQLRRLVPVTFEQGVIIPLQNVFETQSTAFSNYHGGTLRVEKRFNQGLTFLTAYTFSKAISDNPGFRGGGQGLSSAGAQNILDITAEKGLADLDHRHRFTTAAVYELPFARQSTGITKALLGGWATDVIVALQSGLPMTPQIPGDAGSMGTDQALRPDLICNPNLPRGEQTIDRFFDTSCLVLQTPMRYGTAGRGVITGPGTIGIDLGVRKAIPITERVNMQFRAEFFNLPNHANWAPPNKRVGNNQFGVVTSARDPRIIQFGLKLIF